MRRGSLLLILALLPALVGGSPLPEIDPIGEEFRVHQFTDDEQTRPDVAMRATGDFVVVWRSYGQDGDDSGIFGRRFLPDGEALGDEFQVNAHTPDGQYEPSVALQADDGFVVVWTSEKQQDGFSRGITGRRFDTTGTALGDDFLVNTYSPFDQSKAKVASDADGDFVVVWESAAQNPGFVDAAVARLYSSDGNPVTGELVLSSYVTTRQQEPDVAMHPDGSFLVAWKSERPETSSFEIAAKRYDSSGAAVTGEFVINETTLLVQYQAAVAVAPGGDFLVTWSGFAGDFVDINNVYARRLASNGSVVGGELTVNSFTTERQLRPAVAAFDGGGFVVTWESYDQDGDGRGIYGQLLEADGVASGGEFRVNSTTAESQAHPTVAATDVSRAVVVFESGINTNDPEVLAQRYDILDRLFQAGFENGDFSGWDDVVMPPA